jgi:hypothetical protein
MTRNLRVVPPHCVTIHTDTPLYYSDATSSRDSIEGSCALDACPVTAVVFDTQAQTGPDFTPVEIVTELLD